MKIIAPGIYDDLPMDDYHADPCETPSLSAAMINDLLIAPAKMFANSRRLNPDYKADEKPERFSMGIVAHVMFLEPHRFDNHVVAIDYDDYRTNAAKLARDDAVAAGKTPILAKHLLKVNAARRAFLANEFVRQAFEDGGVERSLFWRHPVHGFWCRARADFMHESGRHMCDYKTTENANPEDFGRHAFSLGYHRRAAWYLEGAKVLLGREPLHYWFVNQEMSAPYLTSVVELDPSALMAGQAECDRAADIFARCLQSGDWHGYRHHNDLGRDLPFRVGLPNYAHYRIEQRTA